MTSGRTGKTVHALDLRETSITTVRRIDISHGKCIRELVKLKLAHVRTENNCHYRKQRCFRLVLSIFSAFHICTRCSFCPPELVDRDGDCERDRQTDPTVLIGTTLSNTVCTGLLSFSRGPSADNMICTCRKINI